MKTYVEEEKTHSDTELTLGTNSILGIFFALALICGVFFGFGYSLGRGNTKPVATPQTVLQSPDKDETPPIKTLVDESSSPASEASSVGTNSGKKTPGAIEEVEPNQISGAAESASAGRSTVVAAPPVPKATPVSLPVASREPAAAIMVQIAAVSHREDANVLVSALSKRGYRASIRSGAADNLLHVQIGPFDTRDGAAVMRNKLLNDGYNAILK